MARNLCGQSSSPVQGSFQFVFSTLYPLIHDCGCDSDTRALVASDQERPNRAKSLEEFGLGSAARVGQAVGTWAQTDKCL